MKTVASCVRCGESLVDGVRGCPFCIYERRREAVTTLVACSQSGGDAALCARAMAIDTLRNLGHDQDAVLLARARALDGYSVGEIVEGLVGDGELAGVAA